jgi:hypothetical protein
MQQQALEGREKVLRVEHPKTLSSISILRLVLSNQGKYKEAELLQRQALEVRGKVLRVEHPNTLISIGDLAFTIKS